MVPVHLKVVVFEMQEKLFPLESANMCTFQRLEGNIMLFVFLTSGQDCNSGMQKRIHFRTDMEHYICRAVNNSDVSLGYQFCKNITFILYIINKDFLYVD
jgi:hypothetical protein